MTPQRCEPLAGASGRGRGPGGLAGARVSLTGSSFKFGRETAERRTCDLTSLLMIMMIDSECEGG